jgi:hypothetical protein
MVNDIPSEISQITVLLNMTGGLPWTDNIQSHLPSQQVGGQVEQSVFSMELQRESPQMFAFGEIVPLLPLEELALHQERSYQ